MAVGGLLGCQPLTSPETGSPPPLPHQKIATQHQFEATAVATRNFQHLIYANPAYQKAINSSTLNNSLLYVFIEGDGVAWWGDRISKDPTPYYPYMLRLMTQAKTPALYLGRPCYFSHTLSAINIARRTITAAPHSDHKPDHKPDHRLTCHPKWWTTHRYAQEIVISMKEALEHFLPESHPSIIIIGHSGGGTLALLMAHAIKPNTLKRIGAITLAGNLDVSAWTQYHGYSPLTGSLNPADIPELGIIPQFHFLAANDSIIPYDLIKPLLSRYSLNHAILPNIDHNCCWLTVWPAILEQDNLGMLKIGG